MTNMDNDHIPVYSTKSIIQKIRNRRHTKSGQNRNQSKQKQKPPPYEKKRTPDMRVRPGAQEDFFDFKLRRIDTAQVIREFWIIDGQHIVYVSSISVSDIESDVSQSRLVTSTSDEGSMKMVLVTTSEGGESTEFITSLTDPMLPSSSTDLNGSSDVEGDKGHNHDNQEAETDINSVDISETS
ncbi:hypothetical protein FSP39_009669 [Pinctada imbricata]|uniref:Uncharacterized protein n=1 Tax=Pinctada imbricata TaxID=66713 RepID=A0AA88YCA5_PINIB|nr:hypothetical protein FSP39_009669 [Pinctada imbricata]